MGTYDKQNIFFIQKKLRYKVLALFILALLNMMAKRTLKSLKYEYTLHRQLDGEVIIYTIAKYVNPKKRIGMSNTKFKIEVKVIITTKISATRSTYTTLSTGKNSGAIQRKI